MNASYVSTGNGGPDFEVDVAAAIMVRLLTGTSDRLLGTQQHMPERVTLQDRSGPDGFDDVGVACLSPEGDASRVYIQAKRSFSFTESAGFPRLMRGVHDYDRHGQGEWSAVLAMGDAPSETAGVEELCEIARGSASAAEYEMKIRSPGAMNGEKRRFLEKLVDALEGTEDGAPWRVLRRLRVPECDYHRSGSRDRQIAIDTLAGFLPAGSQAQALAVFDLLRAEVLRSGKTATGYGRATMSGLLRRALGFAKGAMASDAVSAEQPDPTATDGHDLAAVVGSILRNSVKTAPGEGKEAPASRGEVQDLMDGQNKIKEMLEVFLAGQKPDAVQTAIPKDDLSADKRSEDAALHERIDVARDLMLDGEPQSARKQLLGMLQAGRAEGKPYAEFRIRTNLASICLYLGEFGAAIEGYEAAYALRSGEQRAKANLALARLLQDRFEEAMVLAQEALQGPEPVEAAVSYLLQAASRSAWTGNPESLVPPAFERGVQADLGMAEFIRRRERPGWEEASLEMARRHPDALEFRPVEAIAALSLAIKGGNTLGGGIGPVTFAQLNEIADRMQDLVRKMIRTGFADSHDRVAHLNNACVLLRICDRYEELLELLRNAGPTADEEANLRRLKALALVHDGRQDEVILYLRDDCDTENRILHADLVGGNEPLKGVGLLRGLDETFMDDRLKRVRWQAVALLSEAAGSAEHLEAAVVALGSLSPSDPEVATMDAILSRLRGADEAQVKEKLIAAAELLDASSPMHARYFVASRLHSSSLAYEASLLLEGRVDMSRPSAAVALHLACLADARRDGRFRQILSDAAASVRDSTSVLWTTAQHAWNIGDLEAAETAIVTLNGRDPDNLRWQLFRLGLLMRQNRDDDVRTNLEAPLEECDVQTKQDLLQLIGLLGHYGFLMRAGRLAYGVFLERQNDPAAWTAIFRLVLADAAQADTSLWDCPAVGEHAAVDIRYDDGDVRFFIVEPDPDLCSKSPESLEPLHPLVRSLWGLAKDAPFTAPDGRTGHITELRHKVVAQLHRVLRDFGERFPENNAFQKLDVSTADPNGLDELKESLRRHDASSREATANYAAGAWSVAMLGLALRRDQVGGGGSGGRERRSPQGGGRHRVRTPCRHRGRPERQGIGRDVGPSHVLDCLVHRCHGRREGGLRTYPGAPQRLRRAPGTAPRSPSFPA